MGVMVPQAPSFRRAHPYPTPPRPLRGQVSVSLPIKGEGELASYRPFNPSPLTRAHERAILASRAAACERRVALGRAGRPGDAARLDRVRAPVARAGGRV